ncbi:MAG TPA: glycosyltransferase family 39 protein, partial [Nitrolancea sp.]|nr:glycosyltransferase family 39 protein [Nitrolancea sp.]
MSAERDVRLVAPNLEVERTSRPETARLSALREKWRNWRPGLGVVALILCMVSFTASAWVSTTVFDRLPHVEDDVAFLFQAKTIASGHLLATPPGLPAFFQIPFVIIRDGHWFGKYPPGYPAVLALGVLSGQPWLLNPVVGALDVWLVFVAGRRFFDSLTGLLAAALLVSSPFFLLQSGSFMSHTVTLFWSMSFLLLFESTRRTHALWRAVLAGAVIGMLLLSRPLTAVGIGIPFVVWALFDIAFNWRRLREYATMALTFVPFVLAMLQYNLMTTGKATKFAYQLWWPYDKIGFGPSVGIGGHTLAAGILDTRLDVDQLGQYLYGWPGHLSLVPLYVGFYLAVIGLLWRVATYAYQRWVVKLEDPPGEPHVVPELWDLLLAGVVVSLITVHIAYWTPGQMYGPRYYFEAIGAMVLLSSRGILGIASLLAVVLRRAIPRLPSARVWTTAALLIVVCGLTLWNFNNFAPARFREFTNWYNINGNGVRAVHAAGVTNAVVFVHEQQWTDYAPFFSQDTPALNTDV